MTAAVIALFGGYLAFGAEPAALEEWWLRIHEPDAFHSAGLRNITDLRETIRESAVTARSGGSCGLPAGLFALLAVFLLGVPANSLPVMRYAVALFLVVELFTFASNRNGPPVPRPWVFRPYGRE